MFALLWRRIPSVEVVLYLGWKVSFFLFSGYIGGTIC